MPNTELQLSGHRLTLDDRQHLSITGVTEVESFDETTIVLETIQGTLIIRGDDLHIEKLSLDGGEMRVEGEVESLTYEVTPVRRGGFFSRLLG